MIRAILTEPEPVIFVLLSEIPHPIHTKKARSGELRANLTNY